MSSGKFHSSVRMILNPDSYGKDNGKTVLPPREGPIQVDLEKVFSWLLSPPVVWWATLFLTCSILVAPLALVDVPPLLDYPNHLARAYVLAYGPADPHLSQMYAPHWTIIPNLALDLILPPLLTIMPVHLAGRLLLAITLVLPVVGTVLYNQTVFGQRSYWPLVSCMVACNGLFLLGFVNFQLGIGLALICAAGWRQWRETRPTAAVAIGIMFSAILFFSHLMGLLLFLILLLSYEIERPRLVQQQDYSLAASLHYAAWSILIFLLPAALYAMSAFGDTAADVSWETWQEKLIRAAMSVVNYNLPLDIITACSIASLLVALARLRLILVPVGSIVALSTIIALFLISPFGFKGTGYVDARFTVIFGFLLFAMTLPLRSTKKQTLSFGSAMLILFCIRTAQTSAVWSAHNRDLEQLRGAISAVEPGSRVLVAAVSLEEADPLQPNFLQRQYLSDGSRLDGHTAALLLIERHAFWPFLFANPEQQPVELLSPFREIATRTAGIPDVRLLSALVPEPVDVERFPLEGQWSCCYDYVLLMEAGSRPDFRHPELKALYRSDYASMFRVKHALSDAVQ